MLVFLDTEIPWFCSVHHQWLHHFLTMILPRVNSSAAWDKNSQLFVSHAAAYTFMCNGLQCHVSSSVGSTPVHPPRNHALHQWPSEATVTLIMSKAFQFPGHDVVFELVFSNVQIQLYVNVFHLPGVIYSQLHSIVFEFLFQKPISYFSDCKPIPRRQDINNDVCIVLLTRHCHCLYKIQLSILLRSLFYISFLCFN